MNLLMNMIENTAPNAVIVLIAVLYLQRQIASAKDELKGSIANVSERVARLEVTITHQPAAPAQ